MVLYSKSFELFLLLVIDAEKTLDYIEFARTTITIIYVLFSVFRLQKFQEAERNQTIL